MKYFLIQTDKKYVTAPRLTNWYKRIDVRNIDINLSYKLPKRQVLSIQEDKDVFFTDIVSFPFLLISEKCMNILKKYEPKTRFKQIILMNSVTEKFQLYYMPILENIDCIKESKNELDEKRNVVTKFILSKDPIEERGIFQIKQFESKYTIIRLDILESFLRRGAEGIDITPVEIV